MKFGVFWQVPGYEGSSVERRHWETIEELILAEKLGFIEGWLAEAPFYPTRPMSEPLLVVAAAAQLTKKIRFGTLATQVPMHHPLNLATEVATCDILTQGRLDLCIGGRWGGPSSQVMGVSSEIDGDESRAMVAEYSNVLKNAWTEGRLNFKGDYWTFDDVPVLPKPMQGPYPPLLMAANSDGSFKFAAQNGLGVVGITLSQTVSNLSSHIKTFKANINGDVANGNPQPFHVVVSLFVAETREKAHEMMRKNWLDSDVIGDGPPVHSSAIGGGRHDFSSGAGGWGTWDFATAVERCIYDSPAGCIEKLRELETSIPGIDQCILEFNRRGRNTTEVVQNSMKLFSEKVMPHL
ncbi:MAG: LLM class flavin-dependent oxidoreductase [SAR202 cluster bacterium]|nr:LLM class flavin-dependent oxidoreductase [SAR202 cluster bacterium]